VLYFGVYEWLFGATPGKVILKMRVVREDGGPIPLWSALVRGIFRLVDGLVFGWPAARSMTRTPMRQRIGDRVARTVVVGRDDPFIRKHRSWARFGIASAVALVVLTAGGAVLALDGMEIVPLEWPGETAWIEPGLGVLELRWAFEMVGVRRMDLNTQAAGLGEPPPAADSRASSSQTRSRHSRLGSAHPDFVRIIRSSV
jgi:hypothetical protein